MNSCDSSYGMERKKLSLFTTYDLPSKGNLTEMVLCLSFCILSSRTENESTFYIYCRNVNCITLYRELLLLCSALFHYTSGTVEHRKHLLWDKIKKVVYSNLE